MGRRKKDFQAYQEPEMENPEPDPAENQEPELAADEETKEAGPAPEPEVKQARFVSNVFPEMALIIKGQYLRFKSGELVTDDPDVIEAVRKDPWFGIHIHNG